ncbi:hypothetical protein [Streptomyces buecherae]|uniref:Uncharacterized protein n=1 Tax=Streptomyces buecherae TaxID=2763006 RepID=A0A7H8NGI8_9ACTN|nr:hypothetical protein [Streptomyces buecherae]QKW53624.1 hypothetical protein HUT08_33340 [Streptomyces buecherae]
MLGLQRQVLFTRLRWTFRDGTGKDELARVLRAGNHATQEFLAGTVAKCYLEVRSDACPPPGQGRARP